MIIFPGDDPTAANQQRLVAGTEGRRHWRLCASQLRQGSWPQGCAKGRQEAGQGPRKGQGQKDSDEERGGQEEKRASIKLKTGAFW